MVGPAPWKTTVRLFFWREKRERELVAYLLSCRESLALIQVEEVVEREKKRREKLSGGIGVRSTPNIKNSQKFSIPYHVVCRFLSKIK